MKSTKAEVILAPATESQLEVWISCLLGGDDANRSYNLSFTLTLSGELDRPKLEQSLQDIIDRHEALRSAFSEDGTQVLISSKRILELHSEDVSKLDDPQKEKFIQDYSRFHVNLSFDLFHGPLYKIALVRKSDKEHVLIFTIHHIICDGWSLGIFLEELSTIYSARVLQQQPELTEPVSFQQFALEQHEFSDSQPYKDIENFWINQFQNNIPVLELPIDFERPAIRTTKSRRYDVTLEPDLIDEIRALGTKEKASLSITLRAVFEILLYKLTGQDDIVLGLPTAGQAATGNFNLMSNCVNLLPLRSVLKEDLSFKEYLTDRKFSTLDAYDQQQFTFGSLLKKLNVPRNNSYVPLISVVFNVDTEVGENLNFEGLSYQIEFNKREYENFEIFVNAISSGKDFFLEWTYNEQLFKADTIKNIMEDYESMLYAVVKNPLIKIKDILLKDSIELNKKITEWNNTKTAYAYDTQAFKLISERAASHPDKIAIKFRGASLSYKELNDKSNRLAWYLINAGVKTGDKVAVAVERSPEMVACLIAIMKTGAAYIPIDPTYPKKRIDYMLADSSAKLLITSDKYSVQFSEDDTQTLILEEILRIIAKNSPAEPRIEVTGSDLAYVIYTSGSSGQPKGIGIEHHSLSNFLLSMQKAPGISADDKILAITTISFDISGLEIFLPLIAGAELLLADTETSKDGRELLDLLRSESVTIMQATPSTWRMLLETGWEESIRIKALCGGEALPKDVASNLLPKVSQLWNMYGPTETTIWSSIKLITNADDPITIGRPIDNTQIYILDKHLKLVTHGSTGEIYIAGEGLARAYLNKPDLTSRSFLKNPFTSEGERIYRTGDLGKFMPDGEIQCFGRVDNQVKVRGFRIELSSIEYSLNLLEGLREGIVIAREDRSGDQRLVAYVVSEASANSKNYPGSKITHILNTELISGWKHQLREIFPEYMIPGDFVILPKIPLLPNGKLDREALPKPGDVNEEELGGGSKIMPHTDSEKLVANVWEEYLNLKSVGLYDNFFELGGHSMIAVKVMSRLEKETGQRLPLATLFEHSTVKDMAVMLKLDAKQINWDSLVSIKPSGTKMPLYIVHGAGLNVLPFDTLAKNMADDQPVYGLQARGLNGVDEPLEKIEDMAAHYIEEILEQNPNGPYALAGFSFGGLIAFDMAKQLKTMGKEVKVLAIFDSYVDRSDRFDPFYKKIISRTTFFLNQVNYAFTLLRKDPKRTVIYKSESIRRRVISFYWKYRYGKDQNQQGFFGYSHAVDIKNMEAEDRYLLTPYNGSIDLFRAKKRLFYINDFEYLGWKPYALKGVKIHEIPGEHNYIFDYPNVPEFAASLQKCLDNAV